MLLSATAYYYIFIEGKHFGDTSDFIFAFIWVVFTSLIVVLVTLTLIFKLLNRAMEESFNEVVKSGFHTRMKVSAKLGQEGSILINKFNLILDRMEEVVDSNINSIYDVSHEVNNNLTAIGQSVYIVKEYGHEDRKLMDSHLSSMETNIERVKEIMKTILDLAKFKQGYNKINPVEHPLKEIIETLVINMETLYPDYTFDVYFDKVSPVIFIDEQHFYLAISPVIENAVKYSDGSKVISLDILKNIVEGEVHIRVKNKGQSIESKEVPLLFERHYRGDHFKEKKQGSGLGLFIVNEVVDLYKGRVEVESKDGYTTFTLVFPKKPDFQ